MAILMTCKLLRRKFDKTYLMDTIVVEINENNIQNAAELSIKLWPDSSLAEMTAHYEGVLNASSATRHRIKISIPSLIVVFVSPD